MARIKKEDIVAYNISEEVICIDCELADEEEGLTLDMVVLVSELNDDEFLFCDRCKKLIQ